jgi:uncharacterized protein (DUF983 family)
MTAVGPRFVTALGVLVACFACGMAVSLAARPERVPEVGFGVTVAAVVVLGTLGWMTRRWEAGVRRAMVVAMPVAAVAGVLIFRH